MKENKAKVLILDLLRNQQSIYEKVGLARLVVKESKNDCLTTYIYSDKGKSKGRMIYSGTFRTKPMHDDFELAIETFRKAAIAWDKQIDCWKSKGAFKE